MQATMSQCKSPRRRAKRPLDDAWDARKLRAAWDRADPDPTATASAPGVGVTTETLRQWRSGWIEPKALKLRALARLLGVDILDVLP